MEKWLIVVQADCADPSRESEFHEWYDKVHVPDILTVPGVVRVARYENVIAMEDQPKFLTALEVEAEDIWQVTAGLQANKAEAEQQGRVSELLKMVSGAVYRRIAGPVESE